MDPLTQNCRLRFKPDGYDGGGPSGFNLSEAARLSERLAQEVEVAISVIDDACYERTEAMLSILIADYKITPSRLGRAFVVNPNPGAFLEYEKPLSTGSNPLAAWFERQEAAGKLYPGAIFQEGEFSFVVDGYGSLRCDAIPQIYFDRRPKAYWGIGHAAPMIDGLVIDPAMQREPLPLSEWASSFNCSGLIPLVGTVNGIPNLVLDALPVEWKERVESTFLKRISSSGGNSSPFLEALPKSPLMEQHRFYNSLFEEQIHSGALLPHEYWTPLFPGPLTFRGEEYGGPTPEKKLTILAELDSSWEERKQKALKILAPFRAFRELILRG